MITITKFQPFDSGKFRGFVDVSFPIWGTKLNIKGCKVFIGPHSEFVSLPQREYEADGEKKYASIIGIDDEEVYKKMMSAINKAWKEYREANPVQVAEYQQDPDPQPIATGNYQDAPIQHDEEVPF